MTDKQIIRSMLFRQADVSYTTVSPETGSRQCANCVFYTPAHMEYEDGGSEFEPCSCAIVEGWPLAILPTGMCDRHELLPANADEIAPMEVVIVDVETDEEMQYASPGAVKTAFWKRKLLKQDDPPALTIFKSDSGARRMLIVTSNGYEDRENEHVATAALADYVKSSYDKADNYVGANKLLFYHKSVLHIGDIISADMIGGFLVEVAEERIDSPIAKRIWDYIERSATEDGVSWGASHGFRAKKQGNTYVRIKKQETTVLDVSDAANWYTFAGVFPT